MRQESMSVDLEHAILELESIVQPLRQGEFSSALGKVSVYVQSVLKSRNASSAALMALEQKRDADPEEYRRARETIKAGFQRSVLNSLGFARRNLDIALVQALEAIASRPRNPTKTDEQKRSVALQKTFDRLEHPQEAMLEHYRTSSDPLNKYLVAGPWGHEYLRKREIDLDEFDPKLCEMLDCQETPAGRVVLSYTRITRAIDEVEKYILSGPEA